MRGEESREERMRVECIDESVEWRSGEPTVSSKVES
jgi:hypothetical protein